MSDHADIFTQAAEWRAAGKGVALATVVKTWGSSPRPAGAKLAVAEDAQAAIRDGKPRLLDFGVSDEQAWEVGLACGGKIEIFVERVE
jgi:xanthine/CO dehydrogenase XdhC/CoxF family maturation factor